LEIGQPMPVVIKRYLKVGLSAAKVAKKTAIPPDEIERIKAESRKVKRGVQIITQFEGVLKDGNRQIRRNGTAIIVSSRNKN
jgi:hypothetical protein